MKSSPLAVTHRAGLPAWSGGQVGERVGDPQAVDSLLAHIKAERSGFTRQFKAIADHVVNCRHTLAVMRIQDFAAGCGVQSSAVVRFAQRFDHAGYASFKRVFIDEACRAPSPADDRWRRVAMRLHEAGRVACLADNEVARGLLERCLRVAGIELIQPTASLERGSFAELALGTHAGRVCLWLDGIASPCTESEEQGVARALGLELLDLASRR